jgi:hypothetical protein
MEKTYIGKLVDVAQWDDPMELGIVLNENDDFVPTLLTIYLFDEKRVVKDQYTIEMVKFVEAQ